jgi:hypothetical protein
LQENIACTSDILRWAARIPKASANVPKTINDCTLEVMTNSWPCIAKATQKNKNGEKKKN